MASKLPDIPIAPKQLALIAGIVLLVLFCFSYTSRLIASSELQGEVTFWEREVESERQRLERNQALLEYARTDDFVIEKAHTDLGWAKPDEVAIWVVGEEAPRARPVEPETFHSVSPWQLWSERFFSP
ncbi:MAG: hypothetical protein U9R25_13370 [Chloroflexota bacterium]|nr:hypothetical protein [Chloroflexota bacterium]